MRRLRRRPASCERAVASSVPGFGRRRATGFATRHEIRMLSSRSNNSPVSLRLRETKVAGCHGPRSSRGRRRSIDRIAVSLKRISSEKESLALSAAERSSQNSLSTALDGFANLCAYRCPTKRRQTRRRSLRTETVLRLRSHIVAKAAAALPFIRPCDWSCMCVTEQGPSYLTKPATM